MQLSQTILRTAALAVPLLIGVESSLADVGSRQPDVSDPRAIGHRGVLEKPSDAGSSRRENLHEVERARDRGDDRIVDDQTWELNQLREEREARRETDILLDDRDRTLQLEARDAQGGRPADERPNPGIRGRDRDLGQPGAIGANRRDDDGGASSGSSPLDSQIFDDEAAMRQAKRDLTNRLNTLQADEAKELARSQQTLQSAGKLDQINAAAEKIREKYSALRDKAMDDYVKQRSRIMGLPDMLDGPLPPERKPTTTTKPNVKSGNGAKEKTSNSKDQDTNKSKPSNSR